MTPGSGAGRRGISAQARSDADHAEGCAARPGGIQHISCRISYETG
jgi:hypothetical protein